MRDDLTLHFARQAKACAEYGSPFTAALIAAMAADAAAQGPVWALIKDWPARAHADALSLRLAGALHAAALSGRDAALAAAYARVGDQTAFADIWRRARDVLAREAAWVADFIASPPQTNETRRAIGLLAGFLTVAENFSGPIDLLELGASAGLNLHWDHFEHRTDAWVWNEGGDVKIATDWRAPPPPLHAAAHIRSRAACDQNPLDIADPRARLRLKAYIWPDQAERLARFDAAAALAAAQGVRVDQADAAAWLADKLAARAADGATLVYHSVFLQYPPAETRAAIAEAMQSAGAHATPEAPLAWVRFEPEGALGGPRDSDLFLVDLIVWPGGARRILLETDGHARWFRAPGLRV
jgi:hypothetical protein